jgi:hypothetical protein
MQEVVGSIPIGSTLKTPDASSGFFCGSMSIFCFQIDTLEESVGRIDGSGGPVISGQRMAAPRISSVGFA